MEFLAGVIVGAVVMFYDEKITYWIKSKAKELYSKLKAKVGL